MQDLQPVSSSTVSDIDLVSLELYRILQDFKTFLKKKGHLIARNPV